MNLLSQHIIHGAAHDPSARTPPRCHPDAHVKLIARITAWFEGQAPLHLLLGVGNSAVVQTLAEHLNKSQLLGASTFVSRPNKRDNPHGIFVTTAYQLATRIEAYRSRILERLSLDPDLLSGDMQPQFTAFIVEPLVGMKVGTGGRRWGMPLDGLDEFQGADAQSEIIQISTSVLEHADAPLFWKIASRAEPYISNTFDDDEVRRSYRPEYIPIYSTEACEGVERLLRSAFEMTRKRFRHSVQSDWSSDTPETHGRSFWPFYLRSNDNGVYQGFRSADPISQFELLLSVVERSNAVPNPLLIWTRSMKNSVSNFVNAVANYEAIALFCDLLWAD